MSLKPKFLDFNEVWAQLRKTVESVITLRKIDRHEWNNRFSDVYDLCIAQPKPLSEELYNETKKCLEQRVITLHKAVVSSDEELLVAYYKSWSDFSCAIDYLNKLYHYLNTDYIKQQKRNVPYSECEEYESEDTVLEIGELGLKIWKKNMILQKLQSKLVHLLLDGIQLDRRGVCPNQSVFHGVIQSFVQVEGYRKKDNLKLYQLIFEIPYLKATGEYYQQEASRLLQENDCSQYMEKVLQMLDEESFRSRKYLHPSSYSRVTQECEQRMVTDLLQFLHGECKRMVKEENEKDLHHLYLLLKSNPSAVEVLIQELQQHITKNGFEAIYALRGDNITQAFVESVLAVHDKFSNFIKKVFSGDAQFVGALDKACAAVINHKGNPKHMCQSPELMAKYCDSLLKKSTTAESEKDLHNLYLLLKFHPGAAEVLKGELQQHITKNGFEAIYALRGGNIPQAFVESVLAVHDKFSNLIKTVFSGDPQFVEALDKACAAVINHKGNPKHMCQSPELLAKYCDSLLKKNTKTCNENEVENKLARSIIIFKYIDDKDVFQKFYSRMLARRLIHNQSMSMDSEELMINKLKQSCGHEFASKLLQMFTDIGISTHLNSHFMEFLRDNKMELDINFTISVLQTGSWPLAQSINSTFAIPRELEKSVQKFESFYASRFSGRKLTWLHQLCTAEVKLCYLKKTYIVQMSTYQMAVLLLFERADVLSYEEILENTKLIDEQLSKQIQSLLESKLIIATDSEKPIEAGSSFRLNTEYSNKRTKFKLTAVFHKETAQREVQQTHASVDADRKVYLQAAIVRIMKERRVLRHNTLMEEVINQAKDRFVPNVSMIKKCIESLIDKEYIERTPDSKDEYRYIE